MIYSNYTIGGELYHSEKGSSIKARVHKYIDKIRTKTGKWRYIYDTKVTGGAYKSRAKTARYSAERAGDLERILLDKRNRERETYNRWLSKDAVERLNKMMESGHPMKERYARNIFKNDHYYFDRRNPNHKEEFKKEWLDPAEAVLTEARVRRAKNFANAREATANYNKSIAGRLEKSIKNLKKKKKK